MKYIAAVVFIVGLFMGVGAAFANFGFPGSPQPVALNVEYAHYDVQLHTRDHPDSPAMDAPMQAEHGSDCAPPPATHTLSDYDNAAFICAGHVMTAQWAVGYGEIVVTPSQLLDCSVSCSVTFDLSTAKQSSRDWPDIWFTPWNDNLALPFSDGADIDLQGFPRQGIHIDANRAEAGWKINTVDNYNETALPSFYAVPMSAGITAGTNQAAVRQTYKITLQTGQIKFERLASATASGFIWTAYFDQQQNNWAGGFAACQCLMASDYVVQFAHHSYNPTKDGAGVPATWHWFNDSGPLLSPSTPFTLIHQTSPRIVTASNSIVTFAAPAPANAFLRFSGECQILTDAITPNTMVVAPKQTFLTHLEHASSYFIPISAGRTSVKVAFAPDNGYFSQCNVKDLAIWAKAGGPPPTPTPVPPTPTPLPPTPTAVPPTPTPVPPTPTGTPPPVVCQQVVRVNGATMYIDQAPAYCNGAHP